MPKQLWPAFFLIVILVFAAERQGSAQGYIDPGSGAYLLQIAAAALIGALYAVKSYWREIRQTVNRWLGRSSAATEAPNGVAPPEQAGGPDPASPGGGAPPGGQS